MKRIICKFGIDLLIWVLATPFAYLLRVGDGLENDIPMVLWVTAIVILVKLAIIFYQRYFLQSYLTFEEFISTALKNDKNTIRYIFMQTIPTGKLITNKKAMKGV